MQEAFIKLKKEFEIIKEKGYIKGIYNSSSSIGRTFEQEIGLSMNKESMPDYNGIEIKTRRTYTKNFITLFSAVPDGKDPLEVKRITNTYGYPYYRDHRYKCLYAEVFGNNYNYGGKNYKYKLDVDHQEEKVYLCIYGKNNNLIEKEAFWSFKYLQDKLENKLKKLALIHALVKKVNGWNYFNYYQINFYILKKSNVFFKLLENGIIKLSLKIDIYLDEDNYGKMYDHGCSFSISESNLEKLFNKYIIDVDKQNTTDKQ